MVDVTEKDVSIREAIARGLVRMSSSTRDLVVEAGAREGRRAGGGADRGHHGGKEDFRAHPSVSPIFRSARSTSASRRSKRASR